MIHDNNIPTLVLQSWILWLHDIIEPMNWCNLNIFDILINYDIMIWALISSLGLSDIMCDIVENCCFGAVFAAQCPIPVLFLLPNTCSWYELNSCQHYIALPLWAHSRGGNYTVCRNIKACVSPLTTSVTSSVPCKISQGGKGFQLPAELGNQTHVPQLTATCPEIKHMYLNALLLVLTTKPWVHIYQQGKNMLWLVILICIFRLLKGQTLRSDKIHQNSWPKTFDWHILSPELRL